MADGHLGYVMPIGGVAAYKEKVSVVGVGFDIACGNAAIRTDLTYTPALYVDVFADETNTIWVGVHFGSRGFGHSVASGFLAIGQGAKWGARVPEREVLLPLDMPMGSLDACQCSMLNAQCPMPNAQCSMPNAQCPMLNAQCRHSAFSIEH